MNALMGSDLYLKITDKNGKSHVQHHRVWDANRFVAAMQKQNSENNIKVSPDESCKVEVASKSDYDKGRK
jgi:hypothetical protein